MNEQKAVRCSLGVTTDEVEAQVIDIEYFTARDGVAGSYQGAGVQPEIDPDFARFTFCIVRLRNGFIVTGQAVHLHTSEADVTLGRHFARADALAKVRQILGFQLREKLYRDERSKPGLPALSEADARADVAGTQRPDNPGLNTNVA
ncbi:Gp49 family protein [Stenotrophomonas acidaminiphila]|jgi:hypothetical protein